MSNFQLRRRNTRFRREINSRGGRNKLNEEPEGLDSKLGRKLAAFKAQPDSDLAQQFSLSRSRPLFIGACSRCSIHSGATFFPDSIYNYSALKDALHGNPKEARKVKSIDFNGTIKNDDFVKAAVTGNNVNVGQWIEKQNIEMSLPSRLWLWIIGKVLRLLFPRGIFYHPGQLEVLERCSLSKSPFLFLPVHKSGLDEAVIKTALSNSKGRFDTNTFIGYQKKPLFWPRFKLQSHDDWSNQDAAWAVQQATISSIFENNGHILAFLEPKPCHRPNLCFDKNILDHALECMYGDKVDDVQIVPVGISYESPYPKWPSTVWGLCKLFLGLSKNFGSARVDFDQPFSLQEYLAKNGTHSHEELKQMLALHVMKTSWDCCRIMPSEITAFFRKYKNADPTEEDVQALELDLACRNHIGMAFPYRDLNCDLDCLEALASPLISAFHRESVVAAVLGTLVKVPIRSGYEGMNAKITVRRAELIEKSKTVFDLLSFENIFNLPCKDMHDMVDDTIELLKLKEIIQVLEEPKSENFQENWSRRMAHRLEREMLHDSDSENGHDNREEIIYHVCVEPEAVKEFVFLYSLIRPTFKAYYDIISFIDSLDSDACIDISKVCDKTMSDPDQVERVMNRLLQMEAVTKGNDCGHHDCIKLNVKSLSRLRQEVRQYLM